jgi:hypothetical protein
MASLVLLACKLSAQTSTLELQIYDYAGLKPSTLTEFSTRIVDLLSDAGLSAEVRLCRNIVTPCENQPITRRYVVLRLVPGTPKKMNNSCRSPLGQSMAGPAGGTYASLFLEKVQDEAAEANVDWVVVLTYAAAHEIGHLLLGSGAHTPRGLMKAHWDRNDYLAMGQNHFHFSPEQARDLVNRWAAASQTEVASQLAETH